MNRSIALIYPFIALAAVACGSGDAGSKGSSLGLDTDNNGICDGDEGKSPPSTLLACMNDPRCPVPLLQGAACEEACANALARIKADSSCFPSFLFSPFGDDMDFCVSQCDSWGACNPTYIYCFKDGATCEQARQCRIDKL